MKNSIISIVLFYYSLRKLLTLNNKIFNNLQQEETSFGLQINRNCTVIIIKKILF